MNDPDKYFSVAKKTVGRINSVLVPKLIQAMAWDFERGNILDYGSGPGNVGYNYLFPKAEQTNSSLYFLDVSPEMVEYSKRHFSHSRISHVVGSLPTNFPISTPFDQIVAVHVFHLMSDVRPLLKSIRKVLKSGGQFGFVTGTTNHMIFRTHRYLVESPEWKSRMGGLRSMIPDWSSVPEEANAGEFFKDFFVEATGMKEVFFLYDRPVNNMRMEAYLDFAMSVNPFCKNLSEDTFERLRNAYRFVVTSELQIPLDSSEVNILYESVCMVLQK